MAHVFKTMTEQASFCSFSRYAHNFCDETDLFHLHFQISNFLVGLFFLELVEKFGVGPVYAAFGAVSALSVVFAKYFIVETKGRSLEEIELSLNRNFPTEGK